MTGAVAIFVKTPGRSPVKTRLANECGTWFARAWYRRAAAAVASVARVAQETFGLTTYWAVAEDDALDEWADLPTIGQGAGGLGARLARVHARLVSRHRFVLSIGADAPQISANLLGDAAHWLALPQPRFVLGPALDGGFWLIGSNTAPPAGLWEQVRYGVEDTASDLQGRMANLGEWLELPRLSDADHARDLAVVRAGLERLRDPTPEQQALVDWMRVANPEPT